MAWVSCGEVDPHASAEKKYFDNYGVYADRANLVSFVRSLGKECPVSPSEDPAKVVGGATCIANAEELEEHMGAELRSRYPGMEYRALHTALSRRRLPVCIGLQVVRIWVQKYSGSSSSSSVQHVLPEVGEATVLLDIEGADELEAICGEKYRRDVSDYGIGLSERDMVRRLRQGGYSVSTEAC